MKIQILLAEDYKVLRELIRKTLEDKGFSITTAVNGKEALLLWEQYRESGTPFDLLITDNSMPIMTGTELIEKVLEIDPDMKIIMYTGNPEDVNVPVPVVAKLSSYALVEKIREMCLL